MLAVLVQVASLLVVAAEVVVPAADPVAAVVAGEVAVDRARDAGRGVRPVLDDQRVVGELVQREVLVVGAQVVAAPHPAGVVAVVVFRTVALGERLLQTVSTTILDFDFV